MNSYRLDVICRKRSPVLRRHKLRVDVYSGVKARTEKEARLALIQQYLFKGFRVVKISRRSKP